MQQVDAKKLPDKQLKAPKNKTEDEPGFSRQSSRTWQDAKTGLGWQCESPGEMAWQEALQYAKSLSLDGKNDWRLPTLAEPETLLDRSILYDKLRPIMREELPFRDTLILVIHYLCPRYVQRVGRHVRWRLSAEPP